MQIAPTISTISDAIAAHRATVMADEASFRDDGTAICRERAAVTEAAEIATFIAFCRTPCVTASDVQAKVAYLVNEKVGVRSTPLECLGFEEYGGREVYEAFLRSLLTTPGAAPTALAVAA